MRKLSSGGRWVLFGIVGVAACLALLRNVAVSRPVEENFAVVLVGHGIAPTDFPRDKLRELRRLHGQVAEAGGEEKAPSDLVVRLHSVEREIRQWKRTPENDPYDAAVQELAARIKELGSYEMVQVAHNEVCGLDVDEAIESVIKRGASRVIVITTMPVKGGTHSERDIAGKVEKVKRSHPQVSITYAWPFETDQLARFFVEHVNRFARRAG